MLPFSHRASGNDRSWADKLTWRDVRLEPALEGNVDMTQLER
jgi:hypothetical protein